MANIYRGIPYTGTLPAVLTGTKAGNLHRYKVYGNTEQTGTPTPENPIVPSECGELETTGVHAGQYKLPLLSGSTPVDIYIGNEPLRKIGDYADYIDYGTGKIVRQVKKLLLDGTESFTILREGIYRTTINGYLRELDLHIAVCSHFGGGMTIYSAPSIINNTVSFLVSDSGNNYVYFTPSNYQTMSAFKTFIQQQYANGTPVTIWYLLTTPTEEDPPVPFPAIPTSANSTTISWAGEGLAPSLFESIREWADIMPKIYTSGEWEDAQTYTYTNGEWVADTQ